MIGNEMNRALRLLAAAALERRLDAVGTQGGLERQLDHLQRLAHDVGPMAVLEQHVQRAQPSRSAADTGLQPYTRAPGDVASARSWLTAFR
jgi:hypothetical protein